MPKEILNGIEALSINEYLAIPDIPQPYLLEYLLYRYGKAVLVGKPKTGKSWLALKIGLSIALGEPVLGYKTNQAYVLFLEFDRRFLLTTIHEIAKDKSTDRMSIISAPPTPLNEEEGFKLLAASVIKGYSNSDGRLLVIIDHKSACFAGKEGEDQSNRKWLETLDRVNKIRPVTYLVICQAPKDWKGDIVDLPFGSRLLAAWADTVASIQRAGRNARKLEMVSNYGEIDPITYTKDFQIIGIEDEETKLEIVMTYIQEHWDEFVYPNISKKVEESVQKTGVSYSTAWSAYNEVKRLMKAKKPDMQETDETTDGDDNTNNN